MPNEQIEIPDDIVILAWGITAKHLCRGEKDINRIVALAIWQERQKWIAATSNQPKVNQIL